MVLFALIKEAAAAVWANPLRSGLTVLGMVVGVTSVITIVSTVEGMQTNLEEALNSFRPNTFQITRFGFGLTMEQYLERLRRKKITRDAIQPILDGCPDCAEVGAQGYARDDLKYGSTRLRRMGLRGETPNFLELKEGDVASGRYISWEDDRRRRQVAYIGSYISEKLFENEDPLGKRIRIGSREFTVIGVAEKLEGPFGGDFNDFVVIPLSTLQKIYRQPGNPVNLVIMAKSIDRREAAIDQTRVALRSIRRLNYEEEDDFTILTPEQILRVVNQFTAAFRAIIIALPLLSIVVGGIVIMNIMMISVTERTREIGIRKSIGARKNNILSQFLFESLILSLVGGLVGVIFGIKLGQFVLSNLLSISQSPTTLAILAGFSISTVVGLFFGIYPAMKAARLNPIKALSYE